MTDAADEGDGPRVACCQCRVDDLDVGANLDRVEAIVRGLPDDVAVALFPELALTGFVDDERVRSAAVARDGAELDRVRALAAETDTAVLVGFAEDAGDRLFNASAYVRPDGEATVYRKRHLWDAEQSWFASGDRRVVVDAPVGRAGLVTCYDLNDVTDSAWFTAERVDALFVIGAWPADHAANWRLLCRARALDGARWVVACGRTGERSLDGAPEQHAFAGSSMVVRANGTVAASLGREQDVLLERLDPARFTADRGEVAIFETD